MIQLNPPIPVWIVEGFGNAEGSGFAIGWIDYSQEHNTLWKVVMDKTGEIWDIPQGFVRGQENRSMGRSRS